MATPNAPATCRTVLFTAEPAPAFSRGTAPMIAFVAGDIVRPMPKPKPTSRNSSQRTDVCWVTKA